MCIKMVIRIVALDYSAWWCSVEGEEQTAEPWGMPHVNNLLSFQFVVYRLSITITGRSFARYTVPDK